MDELYFLYFIGLTAFLMIILAPFVYFKIVRKLDKVDPSLKYSIPTLLPPGIAQLGRGVNYSGHIMMDSRKYRNLQGKLVGKLHFRKYCSKFDVVLSSLYFIDTCIFFVSLIVTYFIFEL